jgi:hypothetical protein
MVNDFGDFDLAKDWRNPVCQEQKKQEWANGAFHLAVFFTVSELG